MQTFAFSNADDESMPLIALIMKFLSMNNSTPKEVVFKTADVLCKRLAIEKIQLSDAIRLNIIDKLMSLAPHLCIRPLKEVSIIVSTPQSHLILVIDTSGSMNSVIMELQRQIKIWLTRAMSSYTGFTIIFFDTRVYGPFTTLDCLDIHHGNGGTAAIPALEKLRQILQTHTNSHVMFCTDGEFDERMNAYSIAQLVGVTNFVMLFPTHTPETIVSEHRTYLPRITPPNTSICAESLSISEVVSFFNRTMPSQNFSTIEQVLYSVIANEYVMFKNMTIFQMNKLIDIVLGYTNHEIVHNFFSHIIGMYNVMMCRSGDLMNTLRSTEMRLMWGLLQPLKKRLSNIPDTNIHIATTSMVMTFIEQFESQICDMRDKRIAELVKMKTHQAIQEIQEIRTAFNDMKKVDDYDRIMVEIQKMKKKGFRVISVKFNYIANVQLDMFKGFLNIKKEDLLEIFKMCASVGICDKSDPDAIEFVIDPRGQGLVNVYRLMTYRKTDDIKMTLTATHTIRILLGFFSTQFSNYTFTNDHLIIKNAILKLIVSNISQMIMSNVTNMNEPANSNPEWIRILADVSQKVQIKIPITPPPTDTFLWIKTDNCLVLNTNILKDIVAKNTALYVYRVVSSCDRQVQINRINTITLTVNDFANCTIVKIDKEQTPDEWLNEVVKIKQFSHDGSSMPITNKMILQEKLHSEVTEFVRKYWKSGHRLINTGGIAHPASCFGATDIIRRTVDAWMRMAWSKYKTENNIQNPSQFPVVSHPSHVSHVVNWMIEYVKLVPITYTTTKLETIPIIEIVNKIDKITWESLYTISMICEHDGFSKMSGDEQTTIVRNIKFPSSKISITSTSVHTDMLPKICEIANQVSQKLIPIDVVCGIGKNVNIKIRSIDDWIKMEENLSDVLGRAEIEQMKFVLEDFTCPISGEIFTDPVSYGGHIYEKDSLNRWFEYNPNRSSPLTRQTCDKNGEPLKMIAPPSLFMAELTKFKIANV